MLRFVLFFVILITADTVIGNPTTEKESSDIWKILDEIMSKVNNDTNERCKNFENYACHGIEKGSLSNLYFDLKKLEKNDEEIINSFEQTCTKAAEKKYKLDDVSKQFDFIKSYLNKVQKNETLTSKDLAEVAAYFSIINKISYVAFIKVDFEQSGTLFFSIYKQEDLQKDIQILKSVDEFIQNANEAIKKGFQDIRSGLNKDYVKIDSIEKLNELIPTKNFDWETYMNKLKSFYVIEKFKDIKLSENDFKQLKAYFQIIDTTDINTLMYYGIHKFIHVLYYDFYTQLCKDMRSELDRQGRMKSLWSGYLDESKYINIQLDYYNELEKYFEIKWDKFPVIERYINTKRFMLKHQNEVLNKFFKDYEQDQFYKNLLNYALQLRILNKNDANAYSIRNFIRHSSFQLNFKNKPKELFALLETYDVIKLYYEKSEWWLNDENIANKCFKEKSKITVEFFNTYAAMKYALEFFKERYTLPKDYPLNYHQLFSLLLTQYYCFTGQNLEPIIEAFKHSDWFTDKYNCEEGDELYYQKHQEDCNLECPYNKFILKYIPNKFTNC